MLDERDDIISNLSQRQEALVEELGEVSSTLADAQRKYNVLAVEYAKTSRTGHKERSRALPFSSEEHGLPEPSVHPSGEVGVQSRRDTVTEVLIRDSDGNVSEAAANAALQQANEKALQLQNELESLQQDIAKKDEMLQQREKEIRNLEKEIAGVSLNTRTHETETLLQQTREELQQVRQEMASSLEESSSLKNLLLQAREEAASTAEQLALLKTSNAAFEEQVKEANFNLELKEQEMRELNDRMQSKEETFSAFQQRLLEYGRHLQMTSRDEHFRDEIKRLTSPASVQINALLTAILTKLTVDHHALEKAVSEQSVHCQKLAQALADKKGELEKSTASYATLVQKYEALQTEHSSVTDRIAALQETLKVTEQKSHALEEAKQQLAVEVDHMKKESQEAHSRIQELEAMAQRITAERDAANNLEQELRTKLQHLEDENTELAPFRDQCRSLEEQLVQLRADSAEKQKAQAELQAYHVGLKEKLLKLEQENNELILYRKRCSELEEEACSMRGFKETLAETEVVLKLTEDRVAQLEGMNEAMTQEQRAQEASLADLHSELQSARLRCSSASETISELEEKCCQLSQENDTLKHRSEEFQHQMKSLTAELITATASSSADATSVQPKTLEEALKELIHQKQSLGSNYSLALQDLERKKLQVMDIQEELRQQKEAGAALQNTVQELTTSIAALRQQKEDSCPSTADMQAVHQRNEQLTRQNVELRDEVTQYLKKIESLEQLLESANAIMNDSDQTITMLEYKCRDLEDEAHSLRGSIALHSF